MLRPFDAYFLERPEPARSCLQYLRERIHAHDARLVEAWKYGMPFFLFERRMFCYLWTHKKHGLPYIGFVDGKELHHPSLLMEERARMGILLVDPSRDPPLELIDDLLRQAITLRER